MGSQRRRRKRYRPDTDTDQIAAALTASWDGIEAREAVAYGNSRGDRRVSWWAHLAELDHLRHEAAKRGISTSQMMRWWLYKRLPLLVCPELLQQRRDAWKPVAHHLPKWENRPLGTPRSSYIPLAIPEGIYSLRR